MPVLMSAELNKGDIENLLQTFSSPLVRKAIRSALDKTGTWAKNYIANDVSQNFNVSASKVRGTTKIIRTTQTKLETRVITSGKKLSLIDFGAYQDSVGVKVPFAKGEIYNYPHAFINVAKRGRGKFIAIRKGKPRYQVSGKPGRGPSIPTLVNRISHREKRDADMTNHLYKELHEQIARRTALGVQTAEIE